MLTGNEGSGKAFVARALAEELLEQKLENHPYFIVVEPEKKSLTIEQVRELQKTMKLKTTGTGNVRRVAILQDVHTMTTEAQNALLKLLEEPPDDTVLILTAQGDKSLKPTIYSRVQRVHIKPVPEADVSINGVEQTTIQKNYALSGGDMGLLSALISQSSGHKLVGAIAEAKTIITEPAFKRLAKVDELGKDKERLANLLMALKRISSAALKTSAARQDTKNKTRWARILEQTYLCEELLQTNANTKLLLTELFLAF